MTRYSYRRKLTGRELGPALAIGAGLGLGVAVVTTYLAQIFLRRARIGGEPETPRGGGERRIPGEPGVPRVPRGGA